MEVEKTCTYCAKAFDAKELKPMDRDIWTEMESIRRYCPECLIEMNSIKHYWEK